MVLYCILFHGIAWYYMVLYSFVWYTGELPRSASRPFFKIGNFRGILALHRLVSRYQKKLDSNFTQENFL